MFGYSDLKTNIVDRLKTFSQLQNQYKFSSNIYRSGKRKYFSEIAEHLSIEGCPKGRSTCRLYADDNTKEEPSQYVNTEKDIDIFEPIWYSTDLITSKEYCKNKPDCVTYAYTPRDKTSVKKTKLVFLDLTGFDDDSVDDSDDDSDTEVVRVYSLFLPLMKQIYEYIFKKYHNRIVEEQGKQFMCVDNPCTNTYSVPDIYSAYGYYGFRNSHEIIDRFFTIELFQLIQDLDIEKEHNCIVMGYYHANVKTGVIAGYNKPIILNNTYFPAEITIKYGYSINKNCIEFKGEVKQNKRKQSAGKKITAKTRKPRQKKMGNVLKKKANKTKKR